MSFAELGRVKLKILFMAIYIPLTFILLLLAKVHLSERIAYDNLFKDNSFAFGAFQKELLTADKELNDLFR